MWDSLPTQQQDADVIRVYSDADWAGDVVERKSTSGYTVMMAGGALSWKSKKQSVVALSTAEAEYVALSYATQDVIWMRHLLGELGRLQTKSTVVMEDNQSTIAIAQNPVHHTKAKHIDIKYHHIRQAIADGTITLRYCPTAQMVADIFTKPLPADRFKTLRTKLGMVELQLID